MDFANNPKIACKENAFIEYWPTYGPKIREIANGEIETGWSEEIEDILLLLHFFPSKSNQLPLIEAIKKLIVFRVVSKIS